MTKPDRSWWIKIKFSVLNLLRLTVNIGGRKSGPAASRTPQTGGTRWWERAVAIGSLIVGLLGLALGAAALSGAHHSPRQPTRRSTTDDDLTASPLAPVGSLGSTTAPRVELHTEPREHCAASCRVDDVVDPGAVIGVPVCRALGDRVSNGTGDPVEKANPLFQESQTWYGFLRHGRLAYAAAARAVGTVRVDLPGCDVFGALPTNSASPNSTPRQSANPPRPTTPSTRALPQLPVATLPPPVATVRTWAETTGGETHTWTNYTNAGGYEGPVIATNTTVQIACKVQGLRVEDGNTWWYRIAQSPWSNTYYASSDAFYNNGQTSGSLHGTPFVDPKVPDC